jgi:hypothetical protein
MSFFAFNKTVVPALNVSNFYEGQIKYYYKNDKNDATNITVYDTEYEAMNHLIETVDLAPYYDFWAVFYNTATDEPTMDKRYANFVMVMARKTTAVNNNILAYLTQSAKDNDHTTSVYSEDDLVVNGKEGVEANAKKSLISVDKDLTNIDGLGLSVITKVISDDNIDIRDGFTVKEFDNDGEPITIKVLYDKAKELTEQTKKKSDIDPENLVNITLIDVTGTTLKTSLKDWDGADITINVPKTEQTDAQEASSDENEQKETVNSEEITKITLPVEDSASTVTYSKFAPVNDYVDIYREYIDGYTGEYEDIKPEDDDKEEEVVTPPTEDVVIANDSDYVTV